MDDGCLLILSGRSSLCWFFMKMKYGKYKKRKDSRFGQDPVIFGEAMENSFLNRKNDFRK